MRKKLIINRYFWPTIARKWMAVIIFFVLCPFFVCDAQEIEPVEDVVHKLQLTYEKTESLRADFTQETTTKSLKKALTEEGFVYLKKPRYMLWDYSKPEAKKLIINPQKAWLYLPQEKAVYVQKSEKIFQSKTLMRFLSGLGELKNDFTISYAEPEDRDKNGNYLLKLKPREKNYSVSDIRITVDKNNFYILKVSFEDFMGNSTILKFSNIVMNTRLSDKLFNFRPPAGTSVFDMP